jgi:hypothetical protein
MTAMALTIRWARCRPSKIPSGFDWLNKRVRPQSRVVDRNRHPSAINPSRVQFSQVFRHMPRRRRQFFRHWKNQRFVNKRIAGDPDLPDFVHRNILD